MSLYHEEIRVFESIAEKAIACPNVAEQTKPIWTFHVLKFIRYLEEKKNNLPNTAVKSHTVNSLQPV